LEFKRKKLHYVIASPLLVPLSYLPGLICPSPPVPDNDEWGRLEEKRGGGFVEGVEEKVKVGYEGWGANCGWLCCSCCWRKMAICNAWGRSEAGAECCVIGQNHRDGIG
jgi:hypothetical protein